MFLRYGESADGALRYHAVLKTLLVDIDRAMLQHCLARIGGRQPLAIATSKAVDHVLVAASADPRVVKEMHVTAYHVLWELVHVFFEQPGVLGPGVVS